MNLYKVSPLAYKEGLSLPFWRSCALAALALWCSCALANDEKEAFYSQAWSKFEEGKFEEAQGLFAEFKNRFSDPVLSEEADYKIAECLITLKITPP